jgi:hypothetical protein
LLPASAIKPFYYDTGIASSPQQMRSVLEISDINHILFGTDFPYTELLYQVPGDPQPLLSKTFTEQQRHAIERANPAAQFPAIAQRLGIPAPDRTVGAKLVRTGVVKTKTGRTQLRMLFDVAETVQVEARLTSGKRRIAAATFTPIAKGNRSIRWTLPAGTRFRSGTLTLTITDGFGNHRTVRRRIR